MRDKKTAVAIFVTALLFMLGSTSIFGLAWSSARHEWASVEVVGVELGPHVIRERQSGSPIYLHVQEVGGLRQWHLDAKVLTNQDQREVNQEWLGSRLYVTVDVDGSARIPRDVLTLFLAAFSFVVMIKFLHFFKLVDKPFKPAYIVIAVLMLLIALAGHGIASSFGHAARSSVVIVNWTLLASGTLLLIIDARADGSMRKHMATSPQRSHISDTSSRG